MIRIKKMTATFGKLDGETLELTQGLNAITAPNEAGKSTWGAFIHAMFYGIDTGERVKKGTLPAKVKYRPWNGKPMEGVIELDWDGRAVTLQRRSGSRTPMGDFTAYDSETGETIPHLTGENCGRVLLGAESSVFCRSAFIGQNAMAVSPDAGLEQKLSSLVTTGDETVSYSQTERRLRDWKNHVRHNKTGYLPEAEGQLAVITEKLDAIRNYHKEDLELHVRKQELTAQQERLQYIQKNLKAAEALQKQQQLQAAEEKRKKARQGLQKAQQTVQNLPDTEKLTALQQDLSALALHKDLQARMPRPAAPTAPEAPDVFRGLSPEEAAQKAHTDAETLRNLSKTKKTPPLWLASAVLASLCAAFFFLEPIVSYILLGLSVLCLIGYVAMASSQKKINQQLAVQKDALLQQYHASTAEDILLSAARYGDAQRQHRAAMDTYEAQLADRNQQADALDRQQQELLTAVRAFASNIYTTADAEAAIKAALLSHRQLENSQTAVVNAEAGYDAISAAIGSAVSIEAPEEDFSDRYSSPLVDRELEQISMELRSVETTLAQHLGQVQALGDPAALEAEKQQLDIRIRDLKIREQAISAAMAALEEADRLQRSRFAPQIGKTAAELLCRMTGGRYDGLRMEQDMSLHAKAAGEAVTRELLTLSGGTADQVYLALRLAICELALDEGVPLVLDDALVFFDDVRLEKTLELLQEMAEKRQILLFSCQGREEEYLVKERSDL